MFEVQARAFRSARFWYSQAEQIDMQPEYQRLGNIWSDEDQSFLIDSIINDYDIPKLYIADFTTFPSSLNEDRKRYAVIDGKQRLETLFRFFSNELPLSKKFLYLDNLNLKLGGLYYSDLEERYSDVASKVAEYPLPVMHVVTDEVERINQLFVRLNKGSTLTGAEKRNAMIGPVPKIIKKISEHDFFVHYVRYTAGRGQNLNAAAKLLRFALEERPVDTKKVQLDEMVRSYEKLKPGRLDAALNRVMSTLDAMCDTFYPGDQLLSTQGPIPVYYLFTDQARSTGPKVREFLLSFEHELRETRRIEGAARPKEFVLYDNAMRSTNDGGSYETRLEILLAKFQTHR